MSALEQIKSDIEKLSLSERGELVRWLHRWDDDAWDQQMQNDASAGRLDAVVKEADDAIDAGKLRDLRDLSNH